MTTFANGIAIVAGGSRGIGRAVAQRLARDGVSIAVSYRENERSARELVEQIAAGGGRAISVRADISREDDVRNLFDETERELGVPTIVITLAGSFLSKPFAESSGADFESAMAVNAKGTFLVFAEAARRLRQGGRIIGCSSSLVVQGRPGLGLYCGGKAIVEQFVKILAKELGPQQITVNAVAPGPTDTDLLSEAGRRTAPDMTPLGRIGAPMEIAEVVAFLASKEAGWITGQTVGVNGGIV